MGGDREKRNRAEVRRGESVGGRWAKERERERALPTLLKAERAD